MCGIAGFSGINRPHHVRESLAFLLGMGIDTRGGDAAGFVGIDPATSRGVRIGRKLGQWTSAGDSFLARASKGHTTMMHARYATCGGRGVREAHPFEIARHGRPVLWGVHNGCIYNAAESARKHGRLLNVDSAELFELLADEDYTGIQALQGYGVINWIDARAPHHVLVAKLSDNGALFVCNVSDGGIAWGSTEEIVCDALGALDLEVSKVWELATGRVYRIGPDGIFATARDGVRVERFSYTYSPPSRFFAWEASDDDAFADAWMLDRERDERAEELRQLLEEAVEQAELDRFEETLYRDGH